jgi:UDPglucose 6-dehydrogenase
MAKISIIGSGFVGEQVGRGFASLGHEVIFYDPADKNFLRFTKDINHAIDKSQISFICVPTPTIDTNIDLHYIKEAVNNLGAALALQQGYHVVVIKSTVVPTTTDNIVIPALEKHSGKKAGEFGVCVNPEFLTQIECSWTRDRRYKRNFFAEDRIVIGEYDRKSGDVLEELYKPLNKPVFRVDLKTAEMIKYASNCMLTTKISYWNEIFLICRNLEINSQTVADIASMDPRIGKYGTVHGKAFGGKCLPKDLKAFISLAKKYHATRLLQAVDDINEEMKKDYGVRE